MTRRIDHLVVAVRDLDRAADFYSSLGFQVGGRNRHPWGTENRIIQFRTSFIELITLGEGAQIAPPAKRTFSFGGFVGDYLDRREGMAMLALDSADAKADAAHFEVGGIGSFEPFSFERKGHRPDGSEMQVAFSLAFAQAPDAQLAGFFVGQQHYPENFWNAAFQVHENGASDVAEVALSTPDPELYQGFLEAFTGVQPSSPAVHDLTFGLNGGHLDVMTPDDAAELFGSVEAEMDQPSFVGFAVMIADIEAQASRLDAAHVPYQQIGSRLIVPASAAFGVAIAFEAP